MILIDQVIPKNVQKYHIFSQFGMLFFFQHGVETIQVKFFIVMFVTTLIVYKCSVKNKTNRKEYATRPHL